MNDEQPAKLTRCLRCKKKVKRDFVYYIMENEDLEEYYDGVDGFIIPPEEVPRVCTGVFCSSCWDIVTGVN